MVFTYSLLPVYSQFIRVLNIQQKSCMIFGGDVSNRTQIKWTFENTND